jgi:GlcNAc-PI de-N-acetylase
MRTPARSLLPLARFAIAAGLLLAPAVAPRADEGRPDIRDLHIVAHQDDDVLFMNPDIQRSIDAGHAVTTVYLTAGAPESGDISREREAGVMAAYALMAGVRDNWTPLDDKPVRELSLAGRPHVHLVFFRLPEGSIPGDVLPPAGSNLRTLWSGGAQTITAVDGSATYTRDGLVAALADVIRRFHPETISTLDSSGLNGTGQDPSGIGMVFSYNGHCDFYDNSDHYYSALFALAAERAYRRPHQLLRYRAYNIGDEVPNVFGLDLEKKKAVFQAYAEHDLEIPSSRPPFCAVDSPDFCLYDRWQERQYRVDAANPPNVTTCVPQ